MVDMTRSVLEELPERFCWTRFGVEAGASVDRILERKEIERQGNHGLFYWGVGNPVGPGMREMIRQVTCPEVLFSPIAGPPRPADASPTYVVAWTQGETLWGDAHPVPDHSLVTSRHTGPSDGRAHYALVCLSNARPWTHRRSRNGSTHGHGIDPPVPFFENSS